MAARKRFGAAARRGLVALAGFAWALAGGTALGADAPAEGKDMGNGYRLATDLPYYDADMTRDGDTAYADERCRLDVYHKPGADKMPTVLFFHGGGLSTGEKFIPELLKDSGLIVVAPNYRLSSARARCPDYLYDAAASAAWVFRHIADYGGDPDLVFVSGGSGGAYLAAMIGMDPKYLARFGESNRRFAALMPISGQMATHFQLENERTGETSMVQPARVRVDEYAPLHHASKDLSPIVLYAGDPTIEWPTRAEENMLLAATLKRVAGHEETEIHILSGFDHGDVYDPAYLLMKKRIPSFVGRKMRAKHPVVPVDLTGGAADLPFTGRMGGREPWGTRMAAALEGGELAFRVDCPEPRMDALVLGPDTELYSGDCVELFVETAPGAAGQWVLSPDGRCAYVPYGLAPVEAKHAASRADGGWVAELRLPAAGLPDTVRVNAFRRRMADGDDTYTNLSPTFVPLNLTPEAFVPMTLRR